MGYTHYFSQKKTVEESQWKKLTKDASKVLKNQKEAGVDFQGGYDEPKAPVLSEKEINFNGVDDDSHEDFHISRVRQRDFSFCKTAYKPYDLAVTAILLLLEYHAPGSFDISSDGNVEDWEAAAILNKTLFNYAFELPEAFKEENEEQIEALNKKLDAIEAPALKSAPKKTKRYNI